MSVNPNSQIIEKMNVGEWIKRVGVRLNGFEASTKTNTDIVGANLDLVIALVHVHVRHVAPTKLKIGRTLVMTTQEPIPPACVVIPAQANANQW
jgi:hypothetical protein